MRNPSLRHVYATVAELNDTLTTGGGAAMTNAANNALKLLMLDEVSRLIDTEAHRGSGFGPWVGTERYDAPSVGQTDTLWLRADLDALTSVSVAPSQGVTPVVPVSETDFYLAGIGGYDRPYRKLLFHGQGTYTGFGSAKRGINVVGTWSYPYRTRLLTATVAEALDDTETGVDVSALTEFSPGMTILVDSEQMFVTAASGSTLTVERGVNGTTAASHLTAAPITRYVYHASINTLARRLAEKRWKARDAGADGTDGGGDVSVLSPREGETLILRRMLKGIRLVGAV